MSLLEVRDLHVTFQTDDGPLEAVDGVSFSVQEGQTLALVGESGSGKTVCALALTRLLPPRAKVEVTGDVRIGDTDIMSLSPRELRSVRGARIAYVFQDPFTALDPLMRVGAQIVEAIKAHRPITRDDGRRRAIELLEMVGLGHPERRIDQFPHELSGGIRQRVMIAMALAAEPEVLIADEPTTALDVTVQAQIMELLTELQARLGMGLVLITHDLGVVAGKADELLVMYAGRPVERGAAAQVFRQPHHPYTWGLLDSVPRLDQRHERLRSIPGSPPSGLRRPAGCAFSPRCEWAFDLCRSESPSLQPAGSHEDACFLPVATKVARGGGSPD